jgi:hypothetical protein
MEFPDITDPEGLFDVVLWGIVLLATVLLAVLLLVGTF